MKTLYESILDDEDVLISNAKEFANNPLNLLINALEEGNIREVKSLFQNGTFDSFFENALGLNIKLFEVIIYYSGGSNLRIGFKFGHNYIVEFSHWRSKRSVHVLIATKKLFDKKYKNTVLERTNLYINRRRITQNLKKLGFEKASYSNKDYEYYIYNQN